MSDSSSVLAVIPARGGSKGVPRKNLRAVADKPLIAWTIEEARRSTRIDRLVVDTDDAEIAEVARAWGAEVPFLRPPALATDTALIADVLLHLLDRIGTGISHLALLQCTSPLRTAADIDGALALCLDGGAPAVISVSATAHPPQWMVTIDAAGRLVPLLGWEDLRKRRQDLSPTFIPNGAVFAGEVGAFIANRSFYAPETAAFVMPAERGLDIDTEDELRTAAIVLKRRNEEERT
ncbi:MAG: acylneuraminate cytidylyltransferase family protein [Magnetospirillum sp.]|nr:acylneuraminate cytidylyltransferase family protein [Magnetospirillum sp.]